MRIFTEVKDSIYNKEFYKSLPSEQPLSHSIKYLAKLCLFVALLSVILFSFVVPKISRGMKEVVSSVATSFPDDLVVSIKNGNASINKPEPYMVPNGLVGKSHEEYLKEKNLGNLENLKYDNVLVIDTTKPFSVEQFKTFSTSAWITKTELITMKGSQDQIEIIPLSKFGDREINKAWILDKQRLLLNILPWFVYLVIPLAVFSGMFVINFAGSLILLFFYAFIIWLIAKVKKINLSYKNSYRLAIHALTLVLILEIFSKYFGGYDRFWVKIIIFIAIVYLNFFHEPKIENTETTVTN